VAFWLLAGLTAFTAVNLNRRVFQPTTSLDSAVFLGVIVFAIIVACGLLLGLVGGLTLTKYLGAFAGLFVASVLGGRGGKEGREGPAIELPAVRPWVAGIVGALAVFAIAFGVAHAPLTLYDSLSYHLFFPARWLQEHRLSIIPTPFSDEAQAYAPANGELFLLWLMLPFHGDLLARIGQLPFAVLAVVSLYGLARRLGASPEHAVYPPAFFILSRPVLEQAIGANVDLICAAMFLTSVYLGLVAIQQGRRRDWALWGVSVGLYCGSKYVALVYLPVLLAFALVPKVTSARLWAVPGLVAFGFPWYLRNWIVAGSPIYPASLQVAGLTLARGAFDRAAMLNSVFHTDDVTLFPVMAAHAMGPTLFLVWLPVAAFGGIALARRGWWPHGVVALMPYVMAVLYWFVLPVNVDSRFLMPAIAPALVPFAFTFRTSRVWPGWPEWNVALHAAYAAAMVWLLVGRNAEIPAAVPWFMRGWLSLSGLVKPDYVYWCAALAVVMGALWWLGSVGTRWARLSITALVATTTTALAIGGEHWCIPSRCEYLDVTSPHIGMDLVYGWRWMAEHAQNATVAYTGINLPYPLTGEQLTNRVVYVNIDGRPSWRFHDYDRAYRTGRFTPSPPLLATGSGELRPARASSGPRNQAARPRYERMEGNRDAWIDNLRQLHVGYLFISALSAYEVDNVWHNEHGFPIEDAWAAVDRRAFHLTYENSLVRVFTVDLGDAAQ
jgi:hypothetical protein